MKQAISMKYLEHSQYTKYPLWTVTWTGGLAGKKDSSKGSNKGSTSKARIRNPILIEGLPGIGNVGKIVIDLLIENLKAEKIAEFFSYDLPHSVFVQENSLVDLPKLELYHAKINGKDFVFLAGDVQPMTEQATYQFCNMVLDIFSGWKGRELITIGGIGLAEVPEDPKIYITGNSELNSSESNSNAFIKEFIGSFPEGKTLKTKLYGVVGPIIGVTGLLVGLAGKRKINAICLLSETLGRQLYLGLRGARKIIGLLSRKYCFDIKLKQLDKEIERFQIQLKNEMELSQSVAKKGTDVNYIG